MRKPGLIDMQVNGYGGVNFSSPDLTIEAVQATTRALNQHGTQAYCPTVITSPLAVYRHVLPLLTAAMRDSLEGERLLGLHLEGPFISPEDGARGVHPRPHVRPPSAAAFDELYELAGGQVAVLTVAPELPGVLDLIQHVVGLGVLVSIGHTLAEAPQIREAVQAGARLSTHLGNGCPNWFHRHHNPIWPQLAAPELTAMLITDGHHLPPEVIASFTAAKGPARIILTSDAAPAAGCPPGEYTFFGARALLEPSGRLRNLDADTLAGSSATLLDCLNVLAGLGLLSEADLWRVGRENALAALGRSGDDLPEGNVYFSEGKFYADQSLDD